MPAVKTHGPALPDTEAPRGPWYSAAELGGREQAGALSDDARKHKLGAGPALRAMVAISIVLWIVIITVVWLLLR